MMNADLHTLYDALIAALREEIDVFSELHGALVREKEILAGASVDELYESNAGKERSILKAGTLEETRAALMKKIAAALGLDKRGITLSALLPHGDETQQAALKECRSVLRSLVTDIQELNESNKTLLDDSLVYVQKSVDFLGQLIYPFGTYMNTGRLRENNLNGRLVSREG